MLMLVGMLVCWVCMYACMLCVYVCFYAECVYACMLGVCMLGWGGGVFAGARSSLAVSV